MTLSKLRELRADADLKDYLEPVWDILDPEELDTSTEEADNWYDWLCWEAAANLYDTDCIDW